MYELQFVGLYPVASGNELQNSSQ